MPAPGISAWWKNAIRLQRKEFRRQHSIGDFSYRSNFAARVWQAVRFRLNDEYLCWIENGAAGPYPTREFQRQSRSMATREIERREDEFMSVREQYLRRKEENKVFGSRYKKLLDEESKKRDEEREKRDEEREKR